MIVWIFAKRRSSHIALTAYTLYSLPLTEQCKLEFVHQPIFSVDLLVVVRWTCCCLLERAAQAKETKSTAFHRLSYLL